MIPFEQQQLLPEEVSCLRMEAEKRKGQLHNQQNHNSALQLCLKTKGWRQ